MNAPLFDRTSRSPPPSPSAHPGRAGRREGRPGNRLILKTGRPTHKVVTTRYSYNFGRLA